MTNSNAKIRRQIMRDLKLYRQMMDVLEEISDQVDSDNDPIGIPENKKQEIKKAISTLLDLGDVAEENLCENLKDQNEQ